MRPPLVGGVSPQQFIRQWLTPQSGVPLRVLGVDYGAKKSGLAVTDASLRYVPLPAIRVRQDIVELPVIQTARAVKRVVRDAECFGIVVGWPISPSGTPDSSTAATRAFIDALCHPRLALKCPIVLWDERGTSVAARALLRGDRSRIRQRDEKLIDSVAASLILRSFFSHNVPGMASRTPPVAT